ncbi:zinc finger protein 502-like isoform X2 [Labeo rohita]|uniref:Zinc finger protein 502-like isoform X2 n=1 Tax=Labeo rohita TaxID=84645 RepID=A0A498LR25_LABRO|nr:zinc finger protein 502-like isoform X2 [Labeo rohita]
MYGNVPIKRPVMIICDGSLVLMHSISTAFCRTGLEDLLQKYFLLITGQHPTETFDLPILHRCLSHIMKNAKALCKKQIPKHYTLAMHIFGLLACCSTLKEMDEKTTENISEQQPEIADDQDIIIIPTQATFDFTEQEHQLEDTGKGSTTQKPNDAASQLIALWGKKDTEAVVSVVPSQFRKDLFVRHTDLLSLRPPDWLTGRASQARQPVYQRARKHFRAAVLDESQEMPVGDFTEEALPVGGVAKDHDYAYHPSPAGLLEKTLSSIFEVSLSTVSRIILTWTSYLYQVLGSLPLWMTREQVQATMPDKFKLLPSGSISDIEITRQSQILQLLQPEDGVMADKGFQIEKMLSQVGATLIIPPLKTSNQLSTEDTHKTQAIARLRILVERAIRRVKEYHIWDGLVPLSMAGSVNQLWAICCLLSNYQGPLDIKGDKPV